MLVIQRTHRGLVRSENEDTLLVEGSLYGVADGMGGHNGGTTASRGAEEGDTTLLRGRPPRRETLRIAVEAANRRIYTLAHDDESLSGMGTTLSVLWEDQNLLLIAHVGDSRVYRLRDGCLSQVTQDHSVVAELVRNHVIPAEKARTHPMRNIITRAVGIDAVVHPDILTEIKRPGDVWLVCSDGLYDMVTDEEIRQALASLESEAAADRLLALALEHGGADNVSFVLCRVAEDAAP